MLCCRSKEADYYVQEEEGTEGAETGAAGEKKAKKGKKKKVKGKGKDKGKTAGEVGNEVKGDGVGGGGGASNSVVDANAAAGSGVDASGKTEGTVDSQGEGKAGEGEVPVEEAQMEAATVEGTEAKPKADATDSREYRQSQSMNDSGEPYRPTFDPTQLSIVSPATREFLNRSRQNFFSSHSLNLDSPLQENKRYSATDEKFAEYQKRARSLQSSHREQIPENVMSVEQMQAAVNRLEMVAARLEALSVSAGKPGAPAPPAGAPQELPQWVLAFDDILAGNFAKYLQLSNQIGGDVGTQAGMVKAAFEALREFLVVVSRSKKPAQNVLVDLLKPISEKMSAVQEFREKNRTSPMFNHLSGISESIPALGWVTVEPTPGPYVKEMSDAGMFYTNRVLKDYKEKDQTHVDWTKAWLGTLREMIDYIKAHHTTGASWNPQGGDASSASVSAVAPPAISPCGPPPPPPPPPPAAPIQTSSGGEDNTDVRAALFADLNKGEGVTTGLKKVTDDMKTHKNPALKAKSSVPGVRTGPAPFKAAGPPKPAPKPAVAAVKPPVFELQQKKWVIENQIGNKAMVIDDTNLKQTVYIYKCQDSTLVVKGKCNSIVVDSCKKVAVAFDAVVSSIEFINSQSVQGQVLGKCPTVSIEKTDGCQMYLSKESLDTEVVSSKSSEMNILVPKEDGEFVEFALPEQFKSIFNGKKFTTDITESV